MKKDDKKQSEETNVKVESTSDDGSSTTDVSVEKTEKSAESEKKDSEKSPSAPDVNVNIDQNFSGNAPSNATDPHKNYEAAQPVVDPIV